MIRNIIWFFALFLLLLIEAGVLLPFHMAPIGLILIVIALATILSDFMQGLVITFMGGILLDLVSGVPDGLMSISLLIVFLTMQFILKEFLSKEPNFLILASIILGSTVIYYLAFYLTNNLFIVLHLSKDLDFNYLILNQLPQALIWNFVLSYPVFRYYLFVQNLVSKLKPDEEPIRT